MLILQGNCSNHEKGAGACVEAQKREGSLGFEHGKLSLPSSCFSFAAALENSLRMTPPACLHIVQMLEKVVYATADESRKNAVSYLEEPA